MGFVVMIFSIICVVIAWLRSRDRAGAPPSWRRRVRAMGWGLLLLPIAWIAMWLFGVNPATVGLLILLGLYGLAAAFAVFKHGRQVAEVAKAVTISAVPGPAAVKAAFAKAAAAKAAVVHAKAIVVSGGQGNVTAVPRPPGPPKSATLHQLYMEKITSLHQMAVPWASPGVRPSPWYAALTSAGPQGYVPVL